MSNPILSVRDSSISFGTKPLFEHLDLNIYDRDRICLVGRNGEGKSTLLKIITGDYELDSGERWILPGTTIGYLPQQPSFHADGKVVDYVMEGIKPEERTENKRYLADIIITPLQLPPDAMLSTLSGGQLRRADLAKALIEEPTLLLLDEPTNHLDIHTIEWLENYLNSYKGALICISHDRAFLKNISNKIFWLDRGELKIHHKGYSEFEDWSIMLLEQEQKELDKMAKKLSEEELWRNQGVTARRKRNQRRLKELYGLRERMQKDKGALNKLNNKIKLDPLAPTLFSKLVIEMDQVNKSYGEKVIMKDFSMRIMRGDKIGIVGNNGTGKTSFLKIMVGDEPPDSGKVKIGKNITVTYFDQKRSSLDPEETLWSTLCPHGDHVKVGDRMMHVVAYLKNFMFDPKQARDKIMTLSGGQANRLLLAKALADPGSFLVLDEPTNDLDMDTLDMLQEVLSEYKGTLLVVTHDRDFLDNLVTKTILFNGDGEIEEHIGGYSDYIKSVTKISRQKDKKKPTSGDSNAITQINLNKERGNDEGDKNKQRKLSYSLQRELDLMPEKIADLEAEISKLEIELAEADLYMLDPEAFYTKSDKLVKAKEQLEQCWLRWQEITAPSS